jgi:FPC/CPF motif-containing protein YcgG
VTRDDTRERLSGMPVIAPAEAADRSWWPAAAETFAGEVGQRGYPCHFGVAALARGELYTTYVEDPVDPLAGSLRTFLELAAPHQDRRMVLAAFFRPEPVERDAGWYDARFWQVLQRLHELDTAPWPANVPREPTHPRWEFCYAGVPMFVFSAAPTYLRRRSRNLGDGLTILFQPRNVFAQVEGGTPAGRRARVLIRQRLETWDTVAPHPDLGDYGDPSTREWRQYFLAEDDSRLHERCPLHLHGAPPA